MLLQRRLRVQLGGVFSVHREPHGVSNKLPDKLPND
jgi:hypothetical protein